MHQLWKLKEFKNGRIKNLGKRKDRKNKNEI